MTDDIRPPVFVSASELSQRLKISDVQVAAYGRRGVFPRVPHPTKARAFQYELVTSLTYYISILNDRLRAQQSCARARFNPR